MRRLLLITLALLGLVASDAAARSMLVRVDVTNARLQIPRLETLGVDVTHEVGPKHADVVVHEQAALDRLRRAGFAYSVTEPDLAARWRADRASERAYAARVGRSRIPSGRTAYRVYEDYLKEMDALAAGNPGLVRKFNLPKKTVEGRDIVGLEIAKDVNREDDGRPVYVVMGLHHAREWPSAEVNMEFALDLVRSYGKDPRVTSLLDRLRIYVIPVINVDGFIVSRNAAQKIDQQGSPSYRRKNCRAVTPAEAALPCSGRQGVDLNRNYSAYWGGNGASPAPPEDTYRGPSPDSEPEVQAVHELSKKLHITNFQSIHNVAALVLRPPGFKALGLSPDEARLKALGDAMGKATGYSSEYGYQLYEVTGATEDWNYVAQGAFGYTIELGGSGFQGPYQGNVIDQYDGKGATAGKGVREALLLAGEQAANPADHAILSGTATPGTTLRLKKTFKTTTSPICVVDGLYDRVTGTCGPTTAPMLLDDGLDTTFKVPADGRFSWHVNPSTRPFELKAGKTESWTLTCEPAPGTVSETRQIVVARGETVEFDRLCGGGPQRTIKTPPDPASAGFEATLAAVTRSATAAAAARRSIRLVAGRVLTTRQRLLRRRRAITVPLRLTGATLRGLTVVLRDADRQIVARAARKTLRPGRTRVRIRLPRGLRRGTYRMSVKGFTTNGNLPIGAAARIVVRR